MDLILEKNQIIIKINAEDATSFRASINSAIKWIKLSVEINELTDNMDWIFASINEIILLIFKQ